MTCFMDRSVEAKVPARRLFSVGLLLLLACWGPHKEGCKLQYMWTVDSAVHCSCRSVANGQSADQDLQA
jgi:hypothetical protein